MSFSLPKYQAPDFAALGLDNAPGVQLVPAEKDGVMPENYHATTMFPEYFRIGGQMGAGRGQPDGTAWLWSGRAKCPWWNFAM